MTNKNESVEVIYHKEDLDGVLSAAIVKDYYGNMDSIILLEMIMGMNVNTVNKI